MEIDFVTTCACNPEKLFEYISNPDLQPLWMTGVLSNTATLDGATREGSTFRMKIQEGKRVAEYDGEVTAIDPPRLLAVRMWGGNFPEGMQMCVTYRLTEVPGGTRLDYRCKTEGKVGWIFRAMMWLFRGFARGQLKGFMQKLKGLVESRPLAA